MGLIGIHGGGRVVSPLMSVALPRGVLSSYQSGNPPAKYRTSRSFIRSENRNPREEVLYKGVFFVLASFITVIFPFGRGRRTFFGCNNPQGGYIIWEWVISFGHGSSLEGGLLAPLWKWFLKVTGPLWPFVVGALKVELLGVGVGKAVGSKERIHTTKSKTERLRMHDVLWSQIRTGAKPGG